MTLCKQQVDLGLLTTCAISHYSLVENATVTTEIAENGTKVQEKEKITSRYLEDLKT